ncbi:RNA polymerase sigma-70 factor [Chitinophaga sp. Mgbs1]|uniref:RNA polymerase sigma-70 factor n=1 Tax=Chitinophaga solisilvae TaxID=1233460 RepID=A0A9Q5D6E0_9BACT|nr:RNA polymerase sigma-70 factor [Chitinophaga solisilvae]
MEQVPLHNEHALLLSIADGDEYAFTAVYLHYHKFIYEAAMVYLQDQAQAGEVVQEVFYRIWEKRVALPEIKNLRDYLFIIARNLIFDFLRKKAAEANAVAAIQMLQPSAVNNTDHLVEERLYNQLLRSAVACLPPQRKRIYQLAKEEGQSYAEIASSMEISAFTVKNQMVKALRFIRSYIQERAK